MKTETALLQNRGYELLPEDKTYMQKLTETAVSFQGFGAALDEFLAVHGYQGKLTATGEKAAFLKSRFEKERVLPVPCNMETWFARYKTVERSAAFAVCFAFDLSVEETDAFFRNVCHARGFDFYDMREAVYYYCITKGHSWQKAQELIARALPEQDEGQEKASAAEKEVLFAGSLVRELNRFHNENELLSYLQQNRSYFCRNHDMACLLIYATWEKIAGENGLAAQERELLQHKAAGRTLATTKKIYWQLLGMDEQKNLLFEGKEAHCLKPALEQNQLLQCIAEEDFPTLIELEEMLNGSYKTDEKVRGVLILLVFYKFWISAALQKKTDSNRSADGDAVRCVDTLNRYLLDAGYPTLYYGNPFDWLFLFAAGEECPLETFRGFLQKMFAADAKA